VSKRKTTLLGLAYSVDGFNATVPVGTLVRYYPVKDVPDFEETATRSKAWELGSGHVVVLVNGRAGGVSVEHLEVLES